jgi:hypothetical protein
MNLKRCRGKRSLPNFELSWNFPGGTEKNSDKIVCDPARFEQRGISEMPNKVFHLGQLARIQNIASSLLSSRLIVN